MSKRVFVLYDTFFGRDAIFWSRHAAKRRKREWKLDIHEDECCDEHDLMHCPEAPGRIFIEEREIE